MRDSDLIEFLATHSAPCPTCGHTLHGIAKPRCPECGTALVLTVAPRTHFPAAWIVAVTSAGVVACYSPPALAWAFDAGEWWWSWPYVVAFGSFVFIPVTVVLVVWRRRFAARRRMVQWLAAGALATLALAYSAVRWWNAGW